MNCRNCGAASFTEGRCDYCWTVDDTQFLRDVETVAHAYFTGFISEKQRIELMAKLSLVRAGDAIVVPAGVRMERVRTLIDHCVEQRNGFLMQREMKLLGY